jgi:CheY-like chemotaxis protein
LRFEHGKAGAYRQQEKQLWLKSIALCGMTTPNSIAMTLSTLPPKASHHSLPDAQPAAMERRAPARILLVEAGEAIGQNVLNTLKKVERLDPRRVLSEEAAFDQMRAWHPQLLIVGDTLAGTTGLKFCEKLRESSTIPLIYLTPRLEMQYHIQCLNTGADDYITYPYDEPLLLGRLLCLMRRSYRYSLPPHPSAPRGAAQFKQSGRPRNE